jgi:hypothetical protein|tara:strand:+ start:409 stop:885 length:477 start_codon:yes stop_codon:yes gene_type:complete
MQDPNPLPWGAQDRFQAHFIVRKNDVENPLDYTARTILSTSGHFGSKKITGITWNGGKIAEILNSDASLTEMIVNQSPNDAVITVEPTNEGIRIYGKWKNSFEFGVSQELFKIYDTIAYHLKKFSGLGVSSLTSKKNQTKPKKDEQSKIKGTMPKGWN